METLAALARASSWPATAVLAPLGYDERFRRLWTLYLAYCEAGFAERRICEVQMLFAKPLADRGDVARASGAGLSVSGAGWNEGGAGRRVSDAAGV